MSSQRRNTNGHYNPNAFYSGMSDFLLEGDISRFDALTLCKGGAFFLSESL